MKRQWTIKDIPDLSGQTFVITGANSGLGLATAVALAGAHADVILACRSIAKGEQAAAEVLSSYPEARLRVEELDLQDLTSIARFSARVTSDLEQLHGLINNAGIMNTPYATTADGFEQQFGTNHLGHFALTGQLLPVLLATAGSRVVTVSSSGHRTGRMDFANLNFEGGKGYSPLKAYGRSKLANLLFAYELQRKFQERGQSTLSVAAHPGASQTNLGRHIEHQPFFRVFEPVLRSVVQSPEQGALPQLYAAVSPEVVGGGYYGPDGIAEMAGFPKRVKSSTASRNREDARKLWEVSEKLTGIVYP